MPTVPTKMNQINQNNA